MRTCTARYYAMDKFKNGSDYIDKTGSLHQGMRCVGASLSESVCALHYAHPYQLVIAVRLSAQCTDARVNIVTKELFAKYPTLESFAEADLAELEAVIKPCGFYHMKAKSIKEMANQLLTQFGESCRIPWRNCSRCPVSAENLPI